MLKNSHSNNPDAAKDASTCPFLSHRRPHGCYIIPPNLCGEILWEQRVECSPKNAASVTVRTLKALVAIVIVIVDTVRCFRFFHICCHGPRKQMLEFHFSNPVYTLRHVKAINDRLINNIVTHNFDFSPFFLLLKKAYVETRKKKDTLS